MKCTMYAYIMGQMIKKEQYMLACQMWLDHEVYYHEKQVIFVIWVLQKWSNQRYQINLNSNIILMYDMVLEAV